MAGAAKKKRNPFGTFCNVLGTAVVVVVIAALLPLLVKDKKKLGGVIRTVVCQRAGSFALVDMTPAEIGERMEKYL